MTAFATALNQLSSAQKSGKGVSLYSRYINRPAGRVFAALAYSARLSPNQVTFISGVFTFSAITLIATVRPSLPLAVGVYLLAVVGFALDAADGQLARLTKAGSPAGEWLDHILDCAKMLALHMAILVSFYRFFDLPAAGWLLVPIAFQFVAVLTFFGGILTEQLLRQARLAAARANGAAEGSAVPGGPPTVSTARSLALLPADYGVFCVLLLFLATGDLFVGLYSALLASNAVLLLGFLAKWFGELTKVGRAAPIDAGILPQTAPPVGSAG